MLRLRDVASADSSPNNTKGHFALETSSNFGLKTNTDTSPDMDTETSKHRTAYVFCKRKCYWPSPLETSWACLANYIIHSLCSLSLMGEYTRRGGGKRRFCLANFYAIFAVHLHRQKTLSFLLAWLRCLNSLGVASSRCRCQLPHAHCSPC